MPAVVFLLHEACAHIYGNLYDRYPSLDIPMHFIGGFAIAYFASVFIRQCSEYDFIKIKSQLLSAVLIISLTLSAALFWEYAEWICDAVLGTQTQKSIDDTMLDTLVGLLGGGLFVLISKVKLILNN